MIHLGALSPSRAIQSFRSLRTIPCDVWRLLRRRLRLFLGTGDYASIVYSISDQQVEAMSMPLRYRFISAFTTSILMLAPRLPAQQAPSAGGGIVTGHVVLADTHGPARNAVVLLTSLDGQNRKFLRVGLDSTYTFEHVVPGEYVVITYLDGYLSPFDKFIPTPAYTTAYTTIASLFEKIVAAQGSLKVGTQGTQTFDISLERGATVSGRVLYSDGSPAIRVGVELRDIAAPSSRLGMHSVQLGDIDRSEFVHQPLETDDQGHFRIAGIRTGTYSVLQFSNRRSLRRCRTPSFAPLRCRPLLYKRHHSSQLR